jgi:hypothetical protein
MYLKTVSNDAKIMLLCSAGYYGVDAFFDMVHSADYVSKDVALNVLHRMSIGKYHPDTTFIAIHDGYQCHPVVDENTGVSSDFVTLGHNRKNIYDFCEYRLTERIYVWPDGTYCFDEDLQEFLTFHSDDYESYGPTE